MIIDKSKVLIYPDITWKLIMINKVLFKSWKLQNVGFGLKGALIKEVIGKKVLHVHLMKNQEF